jgi:hypothetical protein
MLVPAEFVERILNTTYVMKYDGDEGDDEPYILAAINAAIDLEENFEDIVKQYGYCKSRFREFVIVFTTFMQGPRRKTMNPTQTTLGDEYVALLTKCIQTME